MGEKSVESAAKEQQIMGARASDPSEKGEKAADAGGQQTFLY